jgi:hypothetical protein
MEGGSGDTSIVRIPRAFFREALDLALEAVKARRPDRAGVLASSEATSDRRTHRARRLPRKKPRR